METCFNWCEPKMCWASSDERHWISEIRKLQKDHPDEVTIMYQPEVNDGCIYAKFPQNYIHLYAPKKRKPLTEEQKAELVNRLKKKDA